VGKNKSPKHRPEPHKSTRSGWLRASVLGANDGILSTAGLLVGVAASNASSAQIALTGASGMLAGALAMAAGEYVSVSSQADNEHAEWARERRELHDDPHAEREELAQIYVSRGLDRELARRVADQLTAHDALGAHARDELGLLDLTKARPLQAAAASAASYSTGAAIPMLTALLFAGPFAGRAISIASLVCLAGLGALAAKAGGANALKGAARVGFWGALAMAVTAAVGHYFGAAG
jgi:VIT1/CCC1 family predicted Fe2+/Mn2+ transporter